MGRRESPYVTAAATAAPAGCGPCVSDYAARTHPSAAYLDSAKN